MNKVIIDGRLTRDPEVRYSTGANAQAVARFTLAVDRKRRQGEEKQADFISCVAFGKQGEFVERWLTKGKKINLIGRLQTGSYTNREGVKVYTTDVIAEEIEFAESAQNTTQNAPQSPQGVFTGAGDESHPGAQKTQENAFHALEDEDGLPFN